MILKQRRTERETYMVRTFRFLLETEQGSVVFDPYGPGTVPGLELPELKADLCLCSHGHGDHNYSAGVKLSGCETGLKVTGFPCFHDDRQGGRILHDRFRRGRRSGAGFEAPAGGAHALQRPGLRLPGHLLPGGLHGENGPGEGAGQQCPGA